MLLRRFVQTLGSALVLVSMSLVASPAAAGEPPPFDGDLRSWCTTDSEPLLFYISAGGLYPPASLPFQLRERSGGALVASGEASVHHLGAVEIWLPTGIRAGQYIITVPETDLEFGEVVEAYDCVTAEVECEQLTFTNPSSVAARVTLYPYTSPDNVSVVVPAGMSTVVQLKPDRLGWIALPGDEGHVSDEMGEGFADVRACASLTATPEPVVTGQPRLGATLRAEPGTWQPAPVTLTYRWLRNGTPIARATGLTYHLTRRDLGAHLSFQVTGRRTGYQTFVQVSSETPQIRPNN